MLDKCGDFSVKETRILLGIPSFQKVISVFQPSKKFLKIHSCPENVCVTKSVFIRC